jgi:transcriptional regulator with XRE-family HTH domain
MDACDFKKWRKALRLSQYEAADVLGVGRSTIQNWENKLSSVPRTVELACRELGREWKQRAEFGPITLVYADDPMWHRHNCFSGVFLQCERHPTNEAAIMRACRLRGEADFFSPFIIADDGTIIWSTDELLRECDKRRAEQRSPNPRERPR